VDGLELRDLTLDDLGIYEAVHCDPAMMEHLGGPLPKEGMAEKLRRDVASIASGEARVYVIEPDGPDGPAAGTIAVWEHDAHGDPITEMGWMVLPPFQGRGVGTAAVRAALDLVRAEGRWPVVHALCRRAGFSFVEQRGYEYRGHPLRCNVWRLDLHARSPTS
jgi:RimJ/RimL family protein N-acetyltransferase